MSFPRLMVLLISAVLLLDVPTAGRAAEDSATYRTPPQVIADILTAPRVPRGAPNLSPDGARMILPDLPTLIPIATLAEPVAKLAGLEILPAFHCTRPQIKSALSGFSIVELASGKKVRARLPEDARVGTVSWSTRGDRLACALYAQGGGEVWIVNAMTGAAKKLERLRLNTVTSPLIEWTLDDVAIIAAALPPAGAPQAPEASRIPTGPELRVGAGKPTPQRTARDVLRTAEDQRRFELEASSRLTRAPVDGGEPLPIGRSGVLLNWTLSSDDSLVAVDRVDGYPLGFPYLLFPRTIEIWGTDGHRVAVAGIVPFNDRSAISSVARLGPRGLRWAPDGKSLWFFSWQDTPGADPIKAIRDTTLAQPGTDRLMRLDAPFTAAPKVIATSDFQYLDMLWSADGKRLVLFDGYEPRRQARMAWINPMESPVVPHVLFRLSTERVYGQPGEPLTRRVAHGRALWMSRDGGSVYLAGEGFRPDGQRPFLDALNLKTGKATRLFESAPDVLEPVVALLSADGRRFITLRQSNRIPPNYTLRVGGKPGIKLSDYADPAPALTASQRIQFKFTRPDSVALNAEVVLPADWKPGQRLPTIFWVYPNDYRSASAASENRRSPNRFPSQSPLNPEVLVTQGYAVVYPDLAIVGSNDRYVDEVRSDARAAIDEAARRGFCDPKRVGVGGHSYGAFSTANLLAHTDLFKAGVASDGAYNRTLTPFTFQAEDRTLWQAPETYLKMSPFLHADQIHAPLLLLHNLDDTNVGTNPIQSERMFEALNGLGKVVSLVEYPYEDHGPVGRETVLDYWARVTEWFDRYVKNAGGADKGQVGASPAPGGQPDNETDPR